MCLPPLFFWFCHDTSMKIQNFIDWGYFRLMSFPQRVFCCSKGSNWEHAPWSRLEYKINPAYLRDNIRYSGVLLTTPKSISPTSPFPPSTQQPTKHFHLGADHCSRCWWVKGEQDRVPVLKERIPVGWHREKACKQLRACHIPVNAMKKIKWGHVAEWLCVVCLLHLGRVGQKWPPRGKDVWVEKWTPRRQPCEDLGKSVVSRSQWKDLEMGEGQCEQAMRKERTQGLEFGEAAKA